MLFDPTRIDPALHAALQDCATPSVSTDSLITVIAALGRTQLSTGVWLHDFPCSQLMHTLPDNVFLDRLCVARWEMIHEHLLNRPCTTAIAALRIHCANRGAPIRAALLEQALTVLAHYSSDIFLAAPVIEQLRPSFIDETFLAYYGRSVFHGWDTDQRLVAAWLLHPAHQANPELLRKQFLRHSASRSELWNTCRLVTDPPVFAELKKLILSLPDSWHVTFLACQHLTDTEIARYMKLIGKTGLSLLIDVPTAPIPLTVWDKMTGPVFLRTLMHLYNAEEPGRLFVGPTIPSDLIDRAITDLAIRGGHGELLEGFALASQRHEVLHAHGFDPRTWLSTRLDACFAHDRSRTTQLGFLCRLTHWIDEDPVGRQAIAEDFLDFYAAWWDSRSRAIIDTTPQSQLTITLFRMRPPFLFPGDHLDKTVDLFSSHPTYPVLNTRS